MVSNCEIVTFPLVFWVRCGYLIVSISNLCILSYYELGNYFLTVRYSSFAIILKRKRKLVALLVLSYRCIVTIDVLWLFLTMALVGRQRVIVVHVFLGHTHLLMDIKRQHA